MAVHDDLSFSTPPNWITAVRIALVPVVVGLMMHSTPTTDLIAAIVFGVASATDWLDGYVARRMKLESVYGKLMDPLADKFLVVSALIMLQELGRIHPIVVILLICRELAITGLRALASAEGVIIPASASAKWKTATQMIAVPLIMADLTIAEFRTYPLAMAILYISLGISLWSARDYVVDFFVALRKLRAERKAARRAQKSQV